MKFGKYLKANQPVVWRRECVDYDKLKKIVKRLIVLYDENKVSVTHWKGSRKTKLLRPIDLEAAHVGRVTGAQAAQSESGSVVGEFGFGRRPDHEELIGEMRRPGDIMGVASDLLRAEMRGESQSVIARNVQKIIEPAIDSVLCEFPTTEISGVELEFVVLMEHELVKVSKFYAQQCNFFANRLDKLFALVRQVYELEHRIRVPEERRHSATRSLFALDVVGGGKRWRNSLAKPLRRRGRREVEDSAAGDVWTEKDIANEKKRLRKLFRQEYHALSILSNYRILNATAVAKITKKHDKNSVCKKMRGYCLGLVEGSNFGSAAFEQYLLDRLEKTYVHFLREEKAKEIALGELRAQPSEIKLEKNSCLFGFYSGCSVTIIVAIGLMIFALGSAFWDSQLTQHSWLMFKASAVLSVYFWLWSGDLHVIRKYRFNHIFIFELDPGTVLTTTHVLRVAANATVITLTFGLAYATMFRSEFEDGKKSINLGWLPVCMLALWLVFVIYPGRTYLSTRNFLFRSFWKQLRAPFSKVRFIDFFLADQWTSLFTIIVDIAFSACYMATGDIFVNAKSSTCDGASHKLWIDLLRILPFHVRFWQCLRRFWDVSVAVAEQESSDEAVDSDEGVGGGGGVGLVWRPRFWHLLNAGKYATAVTTAILSALHVYYDVRSLLALRMALAIVSTIYAYSWDVYKDWGLLRRNDKNLFLRANLTFPSWVYYAVMALNLVLRVSWAVALFPRSFGIVWPLQYFSLVLALAEVTRRCIWNVFRLENEHLNNCGEFRVVKDVPEFVPLMKELMDMELVSVLPGGTGRGDRYELRKPRGRVETEDESNEDEEVLVSAVDEWESSRKSFRRKSMSLQDLSNAHRK